MSVKDIVSTWYPKGTLEKPYDPVEVNDATLVFPAGIPNLLPPAKELPLEFVDESYNLWKEIASSFIYGTELKQDLRILPSLDSKTAQRHIQSIVGSFEPKHEYKEAAVAFLLSKWCKVST